MRFKLTGLVRQASTAFLALSMALPALAGDNQSPVIVHKGDQVKSLRVLLHGPNHQQKDSVFAMKDLSKTSPIVALLLDRRRHPNETLTSKDKPPARPQGNRGSKFPFPTSQASWSVKSNRKIPLIEVTSM